MEPPPGPPDNWYWKAAVGKIGIGSRYHYAELSKIRPKADIVEYLNGGSIAKGFGIFIVGPVGTGKTSILSYIAFHLAKGFGYSRSSGTPEDSRYWTAEALKYLRFITATALFNLFFAWNDKDVKFQLDILKDIPILMIDDLGREYRSDFPVSRFEEFIEHRYANELTTLVTSNIPPVTLHKMVEFERIVDRFRDSKWMKLITITGESQRK